MITVAVHLAELDFSLESIALNVLVVHVAHQFGPGLAIELDQALEFAQDMGVAEGVVDRLHPAIGQEVVVNYDTPF